MEIILIIIMMLLLGYFLKAAGVLTEADKRTLNGIVINVSMPLTIFLSMMRNIRAGDLLGYFRLTLLMILVSAVCMGVAYGIGRVLRLERPSLFAFMLVCGIGNTAFMGFPLITGFFGTEGLIRAIFCDVSTVLSMVVASTIFGMRLTGSRRNIFRELVKFPPLIAWMISVVLISIGFSVDMLPTVLVDCMDMVAAVTTPLIMISLGLTLSPRHLKTALVPSLSAGAVRLIFAPLIAVGLAALFGLSGLEQSVFIVEAGMSPALALIIFSEIYGMDSKLISGATFLTTVLSLLTVPVIVSLVG